MEVFQVSQPGSTEPASPEANADGGELTDRTKLVDPMTMEDSSVPFLSNADAAVQSAVRKQKIKPLSLLPLVALIFYDVSGGPFGIEVCSNQIRACRFSGRWCEQLLHSSLLRVDLQDAVSAGGPLLAILGFLILPLVWSVPEALITAELATTFPENSGYVAWVTAAFGPFWGFQVPTALSFCCLLSHGCNNDLISCMVIPYHVAKVHG